MKTADDCRPRRQSQASGKNEEHTKKNTSAKQASALIENKQKIGHKKKTKQALWTSYRKIATVDVKDPRRYHCDRCHGEGEKKKARTD